MFYDAKPVAPRHDSRALVRSKSVGALRSYYVYTPPGYEKGKNKYPCSTCCTVRATRKADG